MNSAESKQLNPNFPLACAGWMLGGSFSAEHGVGSKRIGAMNDTTDGVKLAAMAQVKRLLDPQGLMNPGKVFLE
jgi:FAD/FMN-containing dehydrogenase